MTAACFWSLLIPALKIAHEEIYINSHLNFLLIIFGFLFGALFVHMTDLLLPTITSKHVFQAISEKKSDESKLTYTENNLLSFQINSLVRSRLKRNQYFKDYNYHAVGDSPIEEIKEINVNKDERTKWHRLILLTIAITVHNFPGY